MRLSVHRRHKLVSPAALPASGHPACGHNRHVGTCPSCQREQRERWEQQLAAVTRSQ